MNCKNQRNFKKFSVALAALVLAAFAVLGVYRGAIPDEISRFSGEAVPSFLGADAMLSREAEPKGLFYEQEARYTLLGVIPLKTVNLVSYKEIKVYPGGMPFGVKFYTDGVLVIGFCDVDTENGIGYYYSNGQWLTAPYGANWESMMAQAGLYSDTYLFVDSYFNSFDADDGRLTFKSELMNDPNAVIELIRDENGYTYNIYNATASSCFYFCFENVTITLPN